MAIDVSCTTLRSLSPVMMVPQHDLGALRAGILHIGLGNFHRAHQAIYLDDLMAAGRASDWAILGAGVMPGDAAMRADLAAQDWLFTVVEQDAEFEAARICGALSGFVEIAPNHAPLVAALADPAIRIVSLTVTEGGYFLDSRDQPDLAHPSLVADAAAPDTPTTAFGAIVAGLRARRAANLPAPTVMSCDNLPHNGTITRQVIMGLAEAQDPALAAWIADNVRFPNSMVDRITPATTSDRVAFLRDTYGAVDRRPVFCEPFRQWVLEDSFSDGRPPLEEVGVEFVSDVGPYESMKIRMLNGGHALIAYAAGLLGIEFAHEAMVHPLVAAFFDKVETDEILPVVAPVPGKSRAAYLDLIRTRFANPRVADTISRLCLDGSNRQPKFIVPSIRDNLASNGSVAGLALESALWCRYCMGKDDQGNEIAPNDPDWDHLQATALRARETPTAWLELRDVYGDVADAPAFSAAFSQSLDALVSRGTAATLNAYVTGA